MYLLPKVLEHEPLTSMLPHVRPLIEKVTPLCRMSSRLRTEPTEKKFSQIQRSLRTKYSAPRISPFRLSQPIRAAFETRLKHNKSEVETGNTSMATVEAILKDKYPAKAHAKKVVDYIKKTNPDATGVLYLEGQKTRMIEDNDEAAPFR